MSKNKTKMGRKFLRANGFSGILYIFLLLTVTLLAFLYILKRHPELLLRISTSLNTWPVGQGAIFWRGGGDEFQGQGGNKSYNCSLCPKGMCLSNPGGGGVPQWLRAVSETCWEQREGSLQFSLSPPSQKGLQWPYVPHAKSLLMLDVTCPVDACRSGITHGYCKTVLLPPPLAATTTQFGMLQEKQFHLPV